MPPLGHEEGWHGWTRAFEGEQDGCLWENGLRGAKAEADKPDRWLVQTSVQELNGLIGVKKHISTMAWMCARGENC